MKAKGPAAAKVEEEKKKGLALFGPKPPTPKLLRAFGGNINKTVINKLKVRTDARFTPRIISRRPISIAERIFPMFFHRLEESEHENRTQNVFIMTPFWESMHGCVFILLNFFAIGIHCVFHRLTVRENRLSRSVVELRM